VIGLVEQVLLAAELNEFDEVFAGAGALPSASVARIDESMQARLGEEAGATGCHLAHQLRQSPLRQRVALDLVGDGEVGNLRRVNVGAGDGALEQALMGKMVGAAFNGVAEAYGVERGDVPRLAFGKEPALDRRHQRFGNGMAPARPADQQRIAGTDIFDGFICGDALQGLLPVFPGPTAPAGLNSSHLRSNCSRPFS
jgi:hypothetical protein